jgi:arylsulfatase A-like enzyme
MAESPEVSPPAPAAEAHRPAGVGALLQHLREGLGGEKPERGRQALLLFLALAVVGAGAAWALGFRIYDVQSARVATLGATLATLASTAGAALVVATFFGRGLTSRDEVDARARMVCAVLFAAAEDGAVATSATLQAHTPLLSALGSGVEAFCFLLFPLALLVAVPTALLGSAGARSFGRHFGAGLAGGREDAEGVAAILYAITVSSGGVLAWRIGFRLSETQSAGVAVLASVACVLAFTVGGALLVALLSRPASSLLAKPLAAAPAWLPLQSILMAGAGVAGLYLVLPASHAIAPSAALVGFAVGPQLLAGLAALGRLPAAALLGGSLVLSTVAGLVFGHVSDGVRIGVLGRAPYASILVTMLRAPVDRDHDGYSPILAGGDCDDGNPNIHPGAVDIPDNGIDENCSGTDAHGYTPPVQPTPRDPKAPPMRQNVIMIHVEALRPDHVGFIGYGRPTTPHIDKFRQGAAWFKNAYSPAPTTRFALSMLFTGHEIERVPQSRGHAVDFTLLPDAVTLAERLEPLGYDRVGYTLTYVIQHIKGMGQGFRTWETPWPVNDWEAAFQNSAQQTTDAALKYLGTAPQDGSKPYFLFLHYMSTHDPYIKHPPWNYGDTDPDKYDSALNYQDDQLGRLFDAIDARADKDNTTVILYSDHGELFGEHGYSRHGFTLYQPDVHVLLLVRVPGGHVQTIDTPMFLSDLTPTIFELTGLPPDPECQTWDLLPYLLHGATLPPRKLFFYSDQWRAGVHYVSRGLLDPDGRTKLIRNVSAGSSELFDIVSDPDELHSMDDARPEQANSMLESIDAWEAFENRDHKSFETEMKEDKAKQAKLPKPKFN